MFTSLSSFVCTRELFLFIYGLSIFYASTAFVSANTKNFYNN